MKGRQPGRPTKGFRRRSASTCAWTGRGSSFVIWEKWKRVEKRVGTLTVSVGGLRYRLDVPGRMGWMARYFKEVDADETTVRFWQEIYDDSGKRVETHEKFPMDKGHCKV